MHKIPSLNGYYYVKEHTILHQNIYSLCLGNFFFAAFRPKRSDTSSIFFPTWAWPVPRSGMPGPALDAKMSKSQIFSKIFDFSNMFSNIMKWPKMKSKRVPKVSFAPKLHYWGLGAPRRYGKQGFQVRVAGSGHQSWWRKVKKSKIFDFSNMFWNIMKWPEMKSKRVLRVSFAFKVHCWGLFGAHPSRARLQ